MRRPRWKDWKPGEVRLQMKMKIVTCNGGMVDVRVPHLHRDWESLLGAIQVLACQVPKRKPMGPILRSLTRQIVGYLGRYTKTYLRRAKAR
jgi:hypothetical protein